MRIDISNANLFDLALKLLIRRNPDALLRLARMGVPLGSVTPIQTGIIIKELTADDVFVLEFEGGPVGLYVEYQLNADKRQIRRWLLKALAFEEELGIPVVLLVIYLRPSGSSPNEYSVVCGNLTNHYQFEVIRLWEETSRILSGELAELAPLLPLAEDRPADQAVRHSREIIKQLPVSPAVRGELLSVSYLVGLKYLLREALDAIFKEDLPMLKEAGIIGEWIEEGREEGARRFALNLIERRFGRVPDDLRRRIEGADAEWCESLTYNAYQVESLSELQLPE